MCLVSHRRMRGWTAVGVCLVFIEFVLANNAVAQLPPYDVFPDAAPPYYRVRYEASQVDGELAFPVNYTIWIPPGVATVRGIVVHQHGCGEGSCKSGLTGAFDLHWQALAQRHDCALLAPSYEQPQAADCQLWCDPRNGSAKAFQRCLTDLGKSSGHAELSEVPWALWGHSGGGHWAGGMTLLYPDRIIAAWLRSGVPLLSADSARPNIKPHTIPEAVLQVPIVCNLGTKEGYSVKDGQFAGVWPSNEKFFQALRSQNGLIGLAIDPRSSHECGNQRYLAIAWLDACLTLRLPEAASGKLRAVGTEQTWLANHATLEIASLTAFTGDPVNASWLPNEAVARAWKQYASDTEVIDTTAPPTPHNIRIEGTKLYWDAEADLESGIAKFLIYRDGKMIGTTATGQNNHGRAVFQGLSYSDTPLQPLATMSFELASPEVGLPSSYRVVSVNTAGISSR